MRSILATVLCLSCVSGHCSVLCETKQTGWYAGAGFGLDLKSDAASTSLFSAYTGHQFCNGIKIEYRHTSLVAERDGVDLDGDREADIMSSEDTLSIGYQLWFN